MYHPDTVQALAIGMWFLGFGFGNIFTASGFLVYMHLMRRPEREMIEARLDQRRPPTL